MPRKSIKQMDSHDRPREKLAHYGPGRLTAEELLAILLRTGTQGSDALNVARTIIKEFPGKLLAKATQKELARVSGVGPVKALELLAAVELGRRLVQGLDAGPILSPERIWERMEDVRSSKKEHFVVFYLDTQNVLLAREVVSVGTLNASLIHPREVFEPAVRLVAAHVIVAHNHPAGSLVPSEEDRMVTRRLTAAGEILGISLLDHVIVTTKSYFSFKDQGEL